MLDTQGKRRWFTHTHKHTCHTHTHTPHTCTCTLHTQHACYICTLYTHALTSRVTCTLVHTHSMHTHAFTCTPYTCTPFTHTTCTQQSHAGAETERSKEAITATIEQERQRAKVGELPHVYTCILYVHHVFLSVKF